MLHGHFVKCWDSNSNGDEEVCQGEIGDSSDGPDSHGIPAGVWTDGPGFSLYTVPLESSGPGFQDGRVDGMNEQRSRVYQTGDGRGRYSEGRS